MAPFRPRCLAVHLLVACLIGGGGLLVHGLRDARGLRRDPAALLPAGACLVLEYRGDVAMRAGASLGVFQALEDPRPTSFASVLRGMLERGIDDAVSGLAGSIGLDVADLRHLARSRVTVAFLDPADLQGRDLLAARAVLWMDCAADIEGARRFLEILERWVLRWGEGSFRDQVMGGVTVREYVPPQGSPLRAWYAVRGTGLVLATRAADLERILDRDRSGSQEGSLLESPAWNAAAVPVAGPELLMRLHVLVQPVLKLLVQAGSEEESALLAAGLDRARSLALGVNLRGGSVLETLVVDLPAGSAAFAAWQREARPFRAPARLPHGLAAYAGSRLPLHLGLDLARRALSPFGLEGALDARLRRLAVDLGFDLEADLLPILGEEIALGGAFSRASAIPDLWVCLEVVDPGRAQEFMERWVRRLRPGAQVEIESFAGVALHVLGPAPEAGEPGGPSLARMRLAWAVEPPYLVLSPWPEALRRWIRTQALDGPRFSDRQSEDPTGTDPDAVLRFWVDLAPLLAWAVDQASPVLQSVRLPPPFDLCDPWLAPRGSELSRHFDPVSAELAWTGTALRFSLRSPVGLAWLALAFVGWPR
jgi:hypothetical protein